MWQQGTPTEPGWYWFLEENTTAPEIYELIPNDPPRNNVLSAWIGGAFGGSIRISDLIGQWYGPVEPPPLPKETIAP